MLEGKEREKEHKEKRKGGKIKQHLHFEPHI